MYSLAVFGNWLYSDEKAFAQVQALPVFEKLKELAGQGYFEELIRKYLLDNTHKVIVTLNPEQGKEEREQEVLAEKMAALKASMDTETIAQNIELCSELHKRQAAADTAEALETIPLLERSDIRREVEVTETVLKQLGTNDILYVPAFYQLK